MKNEIEKSGLKYIGRWLFVDDNIKFELMPGVNKKEALYAFVVSNEVKYIGKTTSELNNRFSGYQSPGPTQSTNIANNRKIKEELNQGNNVDIYMLEEGDPIYYKNIKINLPAGLEDRLIQKFNPIWNRLGRNDIFD